MKKHLKFYVFMLSVLLLTSCGNDDGPELPSGEFANGVFIVNEGNFGGGNASVSHFDPMDNGVDNNIFSMVNGRPLGDVAQSMSLADDHAYIVVNNSTKVEIVNYGTFLSEGTITDGLANPRYLAVNGDRAFITNWGSFDENFELDQSFIAVVNLRDNSLITKINTADGVEHIYLFDGKIFASNSFTNTVQAFDMESYELLGTTVVGQGPGQITVDANNNLWVISQGSFLGNNGALTCIRTSDYTIERQLNFRYNPANRLMANQRDNLLYYYSGNTIWEFSPSSAEPSILREMTDFVGVYAIGYSANEQLIYVSDGLGFAGQGRVVRITRDGATLDEFAVGTGPNSFVFTP